MRAYRSAGGVVIDAAGERVLTLLRPGRLGPDGQPEVRLPKGHIESWETRQEAAIREVGEESGLLDVAILADLGHQTVEFDWQGQHYVRDESYFLMQLLGETAANPPEKQFETLWLSWEEALSRVTFEAEREWLWRARAAWVQEFRRPSGSRAD